MRPLLIILSFLVTTLTFSQSLSDKYLHFKTDYYWDTTLYKSEQDYYYEVTNSKITRKTYPVLQYLFTKIIGDTPLVTIDTFTRRGWSNYPYKYVRKGKSIYLQYFDLRKKRLKLNKEYSLDLRDTVQGLANKYTLDSKNGISVEGFSTYIGEKIIEINGNQFKVFRFLEDHYQLGSHPSYHTEEVFLEQSTLIPIKFIITIYDYKTRRKDLYSSVTVLASTSNTLGDYTNKTTKDLVLYENKSTLWTEKQKQEFYSMFASGLKEYADCLLKKLDGHISFFHLKRSEYFRRLVVNKECE